MKLLAVEILTYYTKIIKQEMCSSRKYPYTILTEGIGNSWEVGV